MKTYSNTTDGSKFWEASRPNFNYRYKSFLCRCTRSMRGQPEIRAYKHCSTCGGRGVEPIPFSEVCHRDSLTPEDRLGQDFTRFYGRTDSPLLKSRVTAITRVV